MIVPSAEQIRHQLLLHVVFMRRSWPNEPEIADDMEAACSWLDTLSQEVERLKQENQMLLARVDSQRLSETTGSTALENGR